jgi:hypothetical protein
MRTAVKKHGGVGLITHEDSTERKRESIGVTQIEEKLGLVCY